MKKKNKIPTVIGILLLLGGLFAGIFLLDKVQVFKIGANTSAAPKDVRISNVSDTSATISWITAEETTAFISYGTSESLGSAISENQNDQKYYTHSVTITGLNSSTNYYFKIISNGTTFDNNSLPWQFSTGKTLSIGSNLRPVSGSVITASGTPSKRSIVYIDVEGYLISTLTSDGGTFVLQLNSVRTPNLESYAEIDPSNTPLNISVIAENGETAIAKIFPQSANPVPALVLGQSQDFRNLGPSKTGDIPDANITIPEGEAPESKLDVSGEKEFSTTSVTLDSIEEGEIISSDQPEFFGEGPTGENITITIHSETEITGTTSVSKSGVWSWSPPENLSEGTHTITISWIDATGIARTLTRNFIVQAGELPAYVASPSATPKTTPTPSKTPAATPTPTSTAKAIVPTVTLSPKPKSEELPESGSLTPTLLLSMISGGVLLFSLYLWKLANQET